MSNDVVVGGRIYLKHGVIPEEVIRDRYLLNIYQESDCSVCKNKPHRPNNLCMKCPSYKGKFRFDKDVVLKQSGELYHALPISDLPAVRRALRKQPDYDNLDIVSIARRVPMTHPLRFTAKLYGANAFDEEGNPRADQQKLLQQWLETKIGIIRAPPRTGKTILATAASCHLGVKTVIVAHQYKILKQFYDAFMGTMAHPNPRLRYPPFTNAPELERQYGVGTSVHLLRSSKELLTYGNRSADWPDVLLVSYQKFHRDMRRITKYINPHYSFMVIDEVHQSGAFAYSRVAFGFTQLYRMGLSATPRRKDELDRKTQFTVGAQVAESRVIGIPPIIKVKLVDATPRIQYKMWPYAAMWARKSKARNRELLQEIFRDFNAGHKVIIVPVTSRQAMTDLAKSVDENILWLKRNSDPKVRERWRGYPYPITVCLHGKISDLEKDNVIDRVEDGRPCVLIAMMVMVKQALNMKMPSMIYLNEPMGAKPDIGSPMFQQMSFRVATPSNRKPMEPVVKIWVDNIPMFRSCLSGLYEKEIIPGTDSKATDSGPMYRVDAETHRILSSLKRSKGVTSGMKALRVAQRYSKGRSGWGSVGKS